MRDVLVAHGFVYLYLMCYDLRDSDVPIFNIMYSIKW